MENRVIKFWVVIGYVKHVYIASMVIDVLMTVKHQEIYTMYDFKGKPLT